MGACHLGLLMCVSPPTSVLAHHAQYHHCRVQLLSPTYPVFLVVCWGGGTDRDMGQPPPLHCADTANSLPKVALTLSQETATMWSLPLPQFLHSGPSPRMECLHPNNTQKITTL